MVEKVNWPCKNAWKLSLSVSQLLYVSVTIWRCMYDIHTSLWHPVLLKYCSCSHGVPSPIISESIFEGECVCRLKIERPPLHVTLWLELYLKGLPKFMNNLYFWFVFLINFLFFFNLHRLIYLFFHNIHFCLVLFFVSHAASYIWHCWQWKFFC